jgi:ribosomal protein S27E
MSKMIMEGCQGKPQLQVFEKTCPNCGAEIEIFSVDTEATCEKCGFTIYNDTLNCVQWCKYARQCVCDKMYEQMMKIAERQKAAKASKGELKGNVR